MQSVLVGAVESTAAALDTLIELGHPPSLVVTLPAEKSGRHSDYVDLGPRCATAAVPILRVAKSDTPDVRTRISNLQPDIVFVIGWSELLGTDFLRLGSLGCIGFHPSKLPEMRGRAVIPWTILAGVEETGSSLFWIDEGMDTGDLAAQVTISVASDETARTLYDKHVDALRGMLDRLVPKLVRGESPRTKQPQTAASYCAQRLPEDGRIDWTNSADDITRLVRASTRPYPGAFSHAKERTVIVWDAHPTQLAYLGIPGQVVEVLEDGVPVVHCGDGHLALTSIEIRSSDGSTPKALRRQERFER